VAIVFLVDFSFEATYIHPKVLLGSDTASSSLTVIVIRMSLNMGIRSLFGCSSNVLKNRKGQLIILGPKLLAKSECDRNAKRAKWAVQMKLSV
jgi:hypothetical protein